MNNEKLNELKSLIDKGYSIAEIATIMNLNRATISKYCKQINIKPYKTTKWTKQDSELMSKLLETNDIDEIPFLMKKPRKQILLKYEQPKIRLYNSKLIDQNKHDIIKDMISEGKGYVEIGEAINVNSQVVRKYCITRNMISTCKRKWSDDDVKQLKELYGSGKYSIKDIAKIFNTTIDSIKGQAREYGLEMNLQKSHNLLTEEEKEHIKSNINKKSVSKIAKDLNRNTETIFKYCKSNNIDTSKKTVYKQLCLEKPQYEQDIANPAYSSAYLDRKYDLKHGTSGRIRRTIFTDFKQMTDTFLCKSTAELDVEKILEELDLAYMYEYKIDKWKVDYYLGSKIILEVQGEYWHSLKKVKDKDKQKFKELKDKGYYILEIKEEELKENSESIKNTIEEFWVTHRK